MRQKGSLERFLFLVVMALLLRPSTAGSAKEDHGWSVPSGSPTEVASTEHAMTLDEWMALRKAAEDVMNAPKGPERISRCEAFLKENPGYPEPRPIIRVLVDDTLESGSYDPVNVGRLVERLAQPEGGSPDPSTAWMLEHYCLKYGLPPETARRLLGWSREVLQQQQRSLEKEPDQTIRNASRMDVQEFRLLIDEGRILLAEGDASGALKKLRDAERAGRKAGQLIVLRDSSGEETSSFSSGSPWMDWLYLSMATAEARLGERANAKKHLAQVRNLGSSSSEIFGSLERLREALKVPSPALTEVRAEPVPSPEFTLEEMGGDRMSLSEFRGKVILVMLWTTW